MVVENRCFKESSKGWFSAKSRPFIGMVLALVMAVNFVPFQVYAQGDGQRYFQRSDASQPSYTRADSLRGGVTAERAWWDLTHYHLQVAGGYRGTRSFRSQSYAIPSARELGRTN
jgi:hypothetical protein